MKTRDEGERMTEKRAPYETGQPDDHAHTHRFHFVASNKHVIRYCESCGRSWVLAEARDVVSNRTVTCWTEIVEEAVAGDRLWKLNQC